eukprot:SAG11_NODE_340_length_10476_cov_6.009155_9_plen_163_part_00
MKLTVPRLKERVLQQARAEHEARLRASIFRLPCALRRRSRRIGKPALSVAEACRREARRCALSERGAGAAGRKASAPQGQPAELDVPTQDPGALRVEDIRLYLGGKEVSDQAKRVRQVDGVALSSGELEDVKLKELQWWVSRDCPCVIGACGAQCDRRRGVS